MAAATSKMSATRVVCGDSRTLAPLAKALESVKAILFDCDGGADFERQFDHLPSHTTAISDISQCCGVEQLQLNMLLIHWLLLGPLESKLCMSQTIAAKRGASEATGALPHCKRHRTAEMAYLAGRNMWTRSPQYWRPSSRRHPASSAPRSPLPSSCS